MGLSTHGRESGSGSGSAARSERNAPSPTPATAPARAACFKKVLREWFIAGEFQKSNALAVQRKCLHPLMPPLQQKRARRRTMALSCGLRDRSSRVGRRTLAKAAKVEEKRCRTRVRL